MKVLVVDDEPPARARLVHMLNSTPDFEPVGEAANGMEAVEMVQSHRPAVVLMDIRMPGKDGLEASRHLAQMDEPPAIIFTTAYSEHALEAFDTLAVSYLVKPIRQERLEHALNKARKLTQAQARHVGHRKRYAGA